MKKFKRPMAIVICLGVWVLTCTPIFAQDPAELDPEAYKVEFENEQVRVLRIHYEPHHKGVMHSHPASVLVFTTGGQVKFTFPDGTTEEISWQEGETTWSPATTHQPESLSDEPFDLIQIEIKTAAGDSSQPAG